MFTFQFDRVLSLLQISIALLAGRYASNSGARRKPSSPVRAIKRTLNSIAVNSRKRNRIRRKRSGRPVAKTRTTHLADRRLRSARLARKAARRQWRKPLTRTATAKMSTASNKATQRPAYWVAAIDALGRFGGRCYGSSQGHDPDYYLTTTIGAQMEESTTLLNATSATAAVHEEPTTLLLNPNTLISPSTAAAVIASAMPELELESLQSELAVASAITTSKFGVTMPPKIEAPSLTLEEDWHQSALEGATGILAAHTAIKANPGEFHLYNAISTVVLGMRARAGQPFQLPQAIEDIVALGINAIVPECVWPYLSGARSLAHLLGHYSVVNNGYSTNLINVEATSARKGATSTGTIYNNVGLTENPKLSNYGSVYAAIKYKNHAGKNERPVMKGYANRTASLYTKLVCKCLLLAHVDITVVVPTEIARAIALYFESEAGKNLGAIARYVGIEPNWLRPVCDLEYADVESAFARIQVDSDKFYQGLPGRRPFFYIKDEVGFRIVLGGGIEFSIAPGIGGGAATVYHRAAGSLASYKLRGYVTTLPGFPGEVSVSNVARLEPLDSLWNFFESYGFAALNRPNKNRGAKGSVTEDGKTGFISRVLIDNVPTQYEAEFKGLDNRATFERGKYAMCCGTTPLPFLLQRVVTEQGAIVALAANSELLSRLHKSVNGMYLALAKDSSQLAAKAPALAMTKAINALGLGLVPTGDVSECLDLDLVTIGYNFGANRSKQALVLMLEHLWDTFEPSLGVFNADNELQHVEAFWSKPSIAKEMELRGIAQHEAATTKNELFWKVLAQEASVLLSSKQSKVVKRIAMTYTVGCPIEGEQVVGYKTTKDQVNVAKLLPAVVAPNMLAAPGMGLIQEDAVKAFYSTKEQIGAMTIPSGLNTTVWIQLLPEFAALATELRARVDEGFQLKGFEFTTVVSVKEDTLLGCIMFVDRFGSCVPYANIYACERGHLKQILFHEKTLIGGERKFYVYAKIAQQVTNTLKLRSTCALKLNTLAVKMWHYLGDATANSKDFKQVQLFIYGDSYKGSDNLTAKVKLAAVNYAYYASSNQEMRAALVVTNYAVQEYLGWSLAENDEYLWIDNSAIVAGIYNPLLADFAARFETAIWHREVSIEADLPTIRVAHTRNRAIAALKASEIPNAKIKGEPWRFVGSKEAKSIKGIPDSLIFDIEILERAGTYTDAAARVGTAYVTTNAPVGARIQDQHSVSCMWVTEKELRGKIVSEFVMLDRSYGWGPKNGMQLMFPVEVESIPVPQSMSSTSAMPFSMVQHAIEGNSQLVEDDLKQVEANTHFDGMIASMRLGRDLLVNGVSNTVDLGNNVAASLAMSGSEFYAQLCNPEVYCDDLTFFRLLAEVAGDTTFKLPYKNEYGMQRVTLHLATLYNWNSGSLRVAGDSAVKAIVAWFKGWIVSGNLPLAEDQMAIAGSVYRMLTGYYLGKGHMKGLLRGKKSVYTKVAASCLVPSTELWISYMDGSKYARVFGVADLSEVTTVGFRRMPMFATNISRIRVLQKEDINFYKKQYGVRFCAGIAYIGVAQMYSNFGDLDGDAIEICNMSAEFAAGLCKIHNFETIRNMMIDVLAVDNLTSDYWLQSHADQYIADHFFIGGWKKFCKKNEVSWKANFTTKTEFAELQLAAGAVQTITVGLTYKVATLMAMFAELVPVITGQIVSLNGGIAPQWLQAFSWAADRDTARITIARLIQLYEVALGGYDEDMAKVTLGYLTRAMSASMEVDPNTPKLIAAAISTESSSNFSTISTEFGDFRRFNHLDETVVREALVNLGFNGGDLTTFKNCFMLAGLCSDYSRKPEDLGSKLPEDLRLVFDIIQTVLDISQVKLDAETKNPIAFGNYTATISNARDCAEGNGTSIALGNAILCLDETIRTRTVSGGLFDAYYQNYIAFGDETQTSFEAKALSKVNRK